MIGLERDVLVSFGSGHVRRSNVDTEMGTLDSVIPSRIAIQALGSFSCAAIRCFIRWRRVTLNFSPT